MKTSTFIPLTLLAGIMITAESCAPVFSELQGARTVGKGRVEATPSYSSVSSGNDGESDEVQSEIGLQAAYGITPRLDLRMRYEYIWLKGDSFKNGIGFLASGPKVSLIENKIAFYLPVGKVISGLGEDMNGEKPNTWQLHPTLLFSAPVIKDKLDLNFSSKYLITFCKECDDLVALNFGFAVSSNLNKWAIRPEYGLLLSPAEDGHYSHFSIGISAAFGNQ